MRTQDALSALLKALGFEQMATDVATETDAARIRKYAQIVVKNTPESHRTAIRERLVMLKAL